MREHRPEHGRGHAFDSPRAVAGAVAQAQAQTPEEAATTRTYQLWRDVEGAVVRAGKLGALEQRAAWREQKGQLDADRAALQQKIAERAKDAAISAEAKKHHGEAQAKHRELAQILATAREPRAKPPVAGELDFEGTIVERRAAKQDLLAWAAGLGKKDRSALASRLQQVGGGSTYREDTFAVALFNHLASLRALFDFRTVLEDSSRFDRARYERDRAARGYEEAAGAAVPEAVATEPAATEPGPLPSFAPRAQTFGGSLGQVGAIAPGTTHDAQAPQASPAETEVSREPADLADELERQEAAPTKETGGAFSLSGFAGAGAKAPGRGAPLAITASTPLPQIAEQLQDLSDEELRQRRARLTARLASQRLPPEVRLTIARQRDALEWVQHQRQLASGEAPSAHASPPTQDELFAAAPLQGASSLDVGARARLESAGRTGGPSDEQQTFLHLSMRGNPEQQSALHRQHGAITTENAAFRAELEQTSQRVAQELLDASTRELEDALLQYGLAGGSFRLTTAAKQYQRDPESLAQIIAEWKTLSHQPERASAVQRGAASQAELAATVAGLRAKQAHVAAMEREEQGFTEQDYIQRDAIDPNRSSQSARAELAEAWVVAETEHPILLAFRDQRHGASVARLDELAQPGAELEGAVLAQAIPKLANILRTKNELGAGRLDPLRLGPVLEVAKQRLLVPPGSQRAQLVAELHRQATRTPLAEHVLSALSLGLSLVSFVPGVGLPAKLLAEAAALALELRAQVNEYQEWKTAGGIDNTALDMARSVSASAPELRPLLLRLAVAGASAASLLQLSRLAIRLGHARQLGGAPGATGATGAAESADSLDEIFKEADALGASVGVKKLGEQLEAVGGVRGASVYGKRMFPDGSGRFFKLNLEKVKDSFKKVTRQPRAHDAKLEPQLSEASADAATCTLKLPASTTAADGAARAEAIDVKVELRFKGELSPSDAHGADAGPARYTLDKTNETGWLAKIEIDQHLEPRDVEFIIGHELDEIAELVRRYPAGKPAAGFESEMAAGVMREGATTAKATAHDVANAREIVALHRDYKNLLAQPAGKAATNAEARKQTLDRAIEISGLGEASQIDAKVRLLREASAPEELLDQVRRVESRRMAADHMAASKDQKTFISEDVIDHILWPREKGTFLDKGVDGGHHTARLLELAWPNGKHVFVETATKPAAGTVARRFDQYRWSGEGPIPPPGSGRFPTDKSFDPAGWIKSKMVKTTLDDPSVLLREGEEAFRSFVAAHGSSFEEARRAFNATTANGLEISGYAMRTSERVTPATLFIEASWF